MQGGAQELVCSLLVCVPLLSCMMKTDKSCIGVTKQCMGNTVANLTELDSMWGEFFTLNVPKNSSHHVLKEGKVQQLIKDNNDGERKMFPN